MEIKIADSLKMECEIPLLAVEKFQFEWKTNEHAFLMLQAYIDYRIPYKPEELYGSRIKLWLDKSESQIIFLGYLTEIETKNVGETVKVQLKVKSGTIRLDQQAESRSFQNVENTYAEIVEQIAKSSGGRAICTKGTDTAIKKPFIQYEETAWEFCRRLASRLGTIVTPDIGTGGQNFWFGMRKGTVITGFSEDEYMAETKRNELGRMEAGYEVESREFYKIGDKTVFCGQEMVICRVLAFFERGELIFRYLLKEYETGNMMYQNRFVGLGLTGTVLEIQQEQVKVALDIDGGNSTGDYYYNWYPETGNALYAMPEVGTGILLYFGDRDEQGGFAIHCTPDVVNSERAYKSRYFDTKEGNSLHLYGDSISFANNGNYSLSLGNSTVAVRGPGKISVSAQGAVTLNASRIVISTPDELDICQG